MDSKKIFVKQILGAALEQVEEAYRLAAKFEMLDEQFVLDWLDRLNEISIRN